MLKAIQCIVVALMVLVSGSAYAATGGPDSFGYSWVDSNAPEPSAAYEWIDISTTGTNSGVYGDDTSRTVPIGFEFDFYGQKYSSVAIGSNGYLTFGSYGVTYFNSQIVNSSQPNNIIAPFWDDLIVNNNIYYKTVGMYPNRICIIQYESVAFYGQAGTVTFQILLYEGGKIAFQYETLVNTNSDGRSATVGIEDSSGAVGLQYSYNQAVISTGLAIVFNRGLHVNSVIPSDASMLVPTNTNFQVLFCLSWKWRIAPVEVAS